jgi:hypothetical protein
MRKFAAGDRVKVNANYSVYNGREGVIKRTTFSEEDAYTVALDGDTIPERGFYERELDLVRKDEREALIILAETLDDARRQANAIEVTAPQHGVYGQIHDALISTLETFCYQTGHHAPLGYTIYESIMANDNTVRQAIEHVLEGK